MLLMGIVTTIVGIGLAVYGNNINNDLENQIVSAFGGDAASGDLYLYLGIALAVLGVAMCILDIVKRQKGKE